MRKKYNNSLFISATRKDGIVKLKNNISEIIKRNYIRTNIEINYKQTNIINDIYQLTTVIKKVSSYEHITFTVEGYKANINRIKRSLLIK